MGQLIFQATLGGTTALVGPNTTATNSLTIPNASGALAWSTSALTFGRVPYAGTGGLLQDSANLTFDGSTLTTLNTAYTGTLTGGTGVVNLGSGQFYKDASGNVGIGTSSVSAYFGTTVKLYNVGNGATLQLGSTSNNFYLYTSEGSAISGLNSNKPLTFLISDVEAVRIDASRNVGIGTTANASAILDAQSTTKGVRMPNMTTTQKNDISSPAAGLIVFDTTLSKLCVYSGSAWQTITSI